MQPLLYKSWFDACVNDHTYHVKRFWIYMHELISEEVFKCPFIPKFFGFNEAVKPEFKKNWKFKKKIYR